MLAMLAMQMQDMQEMGAMMMQPHRGSELHG